MRADKSSTIVTRGLVPRVHSTSESGDEGGWVYIVTNKPRGTHIGVTSDLARRAWEHREGIVDGFTKRYGLKRLVLVERYEEIQTAIQREKTMKHRPRSRKIKAIVTQNPDRDDLYGRLV